MSHTFPKLEMVTPTPSPHLMNVACLECVSQQSGVLTEWGQILLHLSHLCTNLRIISQFRIKTRGLCTEVVSLSKVTVETTTVIGPQSKHRASNLDPGHRPL